MESVNIKHTKITLPISQDTINNLGLENGDSWYYIHTYNINSEYKGRNEYGELIFDDVKYVHDRFLHITKTNSGYIGVIDGHFFYDFKCETITDICLINI